MDVHEAHVAAIRANNSLLKGTYEDGYKAGREAGMREAARIASREEDVFIAESAQPFIERSLERHYMALASGAGSVGAAILAAIGEGE